MLHAIAFAIAATVASARPSTVPLDLERGVVFVHAALDDATPLLFVFDPGASDFITTYARDRLHGKSPRRIAIGTAAIRAALPVASGDPQQVDPAYDGRFGTIAGSFGPAFLQRYAIRIDYVNRKMTLIPFAQFKPPANATALRFALDRFGIPTVQASADGIPGRFEIDVRAPSNMLFAPFVQQYEPSRLRVARGPSRFSIGPYALEPTPTWFSNARVGKFASSDVSGLIGNAALSHFIVTFDYHSHTVYLAPA